MEIRYCCEGMYQCLFGDPVYGDVRLITTSMQMGVLKYCPFCGAKITETRIYKEKKVK